MTLVGPSARCQQRQNLTFTPTHDAVTPSIQEEGAEHIFQCVTVSCLMFLFSLNFSCSSCELFSSFLVFLSLAGGFWPFFSRRGGWPFLLGKVLAIFEAGVAPSFSSLGWPFLSGWSSLPWVGVGLFSRVKVGPSFSGEGWPSGPGWPGPKGEGQPKKGRKGRAGAQPKGKEGEGPGLTQE